MTRAARATAVTLAAVLAAGCTVIHVDPVPAGSLGPGTVCIEENPKVVLRDFLPTLEAGFARHGIMTEVHPYPLPEHCEFVVSYTARQSWDLAKYLSIADIEVRRNGDRIAHAHYHLRGKGGYALTKYQGTATKMRPVLDGLLENYRPGAAE